MSILNDREIRALCEPEVGKVKFGISRGMHTSEITASLYANDGPDFVASAIRIATAHGSRNPKAHLITMNCDTRNEYLAENFKPMIEPFVPHQVKTRRVPPAHDRRDWDEAEWTEERILSYGNSSFGYDLRLGHKFKVFTNVNAAIVDPKNFDSKSFIDVEVPEVGGKIIIPPNSFILGYSLEYMRIPDNVLGVVLGKSTIARMGINCLCTPLEPGWEGYVTLEFSNSTPLPACLYVGEGCCQVTFQMGNRPEVTYGDRGGKYQNQVAEPVVSKV